MARNLRVAAAQLGPIQKTDDRKTAVARLIAMLREAAAKKAELVVFPELALTTFFPRWFVENISDADHWYETEMPSPITAPLFDEAKKLGVGFCLGYAELT
ncbi:MAG: nitrilase-related carbon-nitrogen hydrolase, partial [Actinomycetota bacterium]